ncbi:thiol reductant ABC exporter subunit CydC [Corynebacterium callunae]|uniref:thiol reductant ABC exporter subunit CydC n=1 Tax=Corynebacterium callunae TaxID=1721 RepID=UPI0039824DBF
MNQLAAIRSREVILPVLAGTVTMLASMTLTVVSAWLITKAWEMPPVMDLTVAVTAVRALGISRAVFRYIERVVSHKLALDVASRTRTAAYERLANSPATAMSLKRGDLLSRLGADIDALSDVIVRSVVPSGVALVSSVLAVAFAAFLSWPVALVLATGLILAAIIPPALAARGVRHAEIARAIAVQEYVSAVDHVLVDQAGLRVRGDMPAALATAEQAAQSYAKADDAGSRFSAIGVGTSIWIHGFSVIGVLLVAASYYTSGDHSPQWLGVSVLLSLAAFEAVSVLPDAAIARTRAAGAAGRLADIANIPAATPPEAAEAPAEPSIVAKDLVYGWDSDLGTCNLNLPFGSRHEIIAPSGTGKTTLLLTLAGFLTPRSGTVLIGGKDPAQLSGTVLFSPEDGHIFATTLRDNLALGAPTATDAEMLDILEAVGLSSWFSGLEQGLSTLLNHGADSLSGGQRRRVLLARALLSDAPILLLDEPTEHLDAQGSAEMLSLLSRDELPGSRARRTVVVVRHVR